MSDSMHTPSDPGYWPYYCEENTWRRCRVDPASRHAVFVTGAGGNVLMACQQVGTGPRHAVAWDYHVFTLARSATGTRVLDPDHVGGEPVSLGRYLDESFPPLQAGMHSFAPRFRVVGGETFLRHFASDRSHMRDSEGGWQQPPPPWPAIGEGNNLARYIDMNDAFEGERLGLQALRARFD